MDEENKKKRIFLIIYLAMNMDFIRHQRNPLEGGTGDYKFYLFIKKLLFPKDCCYSVGPCLLAKPAIHGRK